MILTKLTNSEAIEMIIEAFELIDADHWADPEDMATMTLKNLNYLAAKNAAYEFRLNWRENGEPAFVYQDNQNFIISVDALNYSMKALGIHGLREFLTLNQGVPLISVAIQLMLLTAEVEAEALEDWLDYEDSTASDFVADLLISLQMAAEKFKSEKEIN